MASLRQFTKRLFILLNGICCILFLLCCCNSFLHPDSWWFISLLVFFFPLFLVLCLVFLIFWIFVSPRYLLLSLLTLAIGWRSIHAFFGFSVTPNDFSKKPENSIRVLTWNVRGFDEFVNKKTGSLGHRQLMMDHIAGQQADILCFQEFYEPADTAHSNIRYIEKVLHFPYHFLSGDFHSAKKKFMSGVVIFSKFPIVHTEQAKYTNQDSLHAESVISADVNVNGSLIRVFTTHLQSVLFKTKDFRDVETIRNADDSMLEASRSLAHKLSYALRLRGYQADTVRRNLDASPYPVIICGDFNDVPNSYTYFRIRGDRQDAFIAKSFGIGRTYIHIAPTLRIDYIMPGQEFSVLQSGKLVTPWSDHHAVMADLRLQDAKR